MAPSRAVLGATLLSVAVVFLAATCAGAATHNLRGSSPSSFARTNSSAKRHASHRGATSPASGNTPAARGSQATPTSRRALQALDPATAAAYDLIALAGQALRVRREANPEDDVTFSLAADAVAPLLDRATVERAQVPTTSGVGLAGLPLSGAEDPASAADDAATLAVLLASAQSPINIAPSSAVLASDPTGTFYTSTMEVRAEGAREASACTCLSPQRSASVHCISPSGSGSLSCNLRVP